ncbi:hypothetical protein [Mesorhizobium mediterraneum]|uniref:hypothetical protein n=1 Tax=Mesorhizobium mediterraneum TaxID=43617 RepID=UPI001AEF2689|nr:hypothetical protein [Mesorhizobium mediterraneum]
MTQYLRQPADPDAIRHDLGLGERTADRVDLVRAAKRLKLKAKIAKPSPAAQVAGRAPQAGQPGR